MLGPRRLKAKGHSRVPPSVLPQRGPHDVPPPSPGTASRPRRRSAAKMGANIPRAGITRIRPGAFAKT
eukprot:4654817-Pyramimonas_sp.AAC.1